MTILRCRMTGESARVEAVMTGLHGLDGVEAIEEVATRPEHMRDDSSSLGLTDDDGGDFHDVEIHARGDHDAALAHRLIERMAADAGIGVEFVDRF